MNQASKPHACKGAAHSFESAEANAAQEMRVEMTARFVTMSGRVAREPGHRGPPAECHCPSPENALPPTWSGGHSGAQPERFAADRGWSRGSRPRPRLSGEPGERWVSTATCHSTRSRHACHHPGEYQGVGDDKNDLQWTLPTSALKATGSHTPSGRLIRRTNHISSMPSLPKRKELPYLSSRKRMDCWIETSKMGTRARQKVKCDGRNKIVSVCHNLKCVQTAPTKESNRSC